MSDNRACLGRPGNPKIASAIPTIKQYNNSIIEDHEIYMERGFPGSYNQIYR